MFGESPSKSHTDNQIISILRREDRSNDERLISVLCAWDDTEYVAYADGLTALGFAFAGEQIGLTVWVPRNCAAKAPGERGRDWFPTMKAHNITPQEFEGHTTHKCQISFKSRHIAGFGQREYPKLDNVRHRIADIIDEAALSDLKPGLGRREVIFMAWGSKMELSLLALLGREAPLHLPYPEVDVAGIVLGHRPRGTGPCPIREIRMASW